MKSHNLILSNLNIYTDNTVLKNAHIILKDEKICAIHNELSHKNYPSYKIIEFPDGYHLLPGFIDLHTHGALDCDIMDGTTDALTTISNALAQEGTTGFLATTMTAPEKKIDSVLSAIHHFIPLQQETLGAKILGIHLEGPFISQKKLGAQNSADILHPSIQKFENWQQLSGNHIKLVTLAPELPYALEFIAYLKQKNIVASIGHTNATYEEALSAIDTGCSHVTHLFNAMSGLHQREPGVVTATLLSHRVTAELIVDGIHLHPAIVKLAFQLKGKEKIVLVTDAMRAKCMCNGIYELGGQNVTVNNDIATLSNGTLAGSTLKMNSAIKNMMQFTHCNLNDITTMTSVNPAKILNIFHQKGSIAQNKDADLVILDEDFNVILTIGAGKIIYNKIPNKFI